MATSYASSADNPTTRLELAQHNPSDKRVQLRHLAPRQPWLLGDAQVAPSKINPRTFTGYPKQRPHNTGIGHRCKRHWQAAVDQATVYWPRPTRLKILCLVSVWLTIVRKFGDVVT